MMADSRRVSRLPAAFARLSTGVKMLIILSGALLPLGLIALFASLDSARDYRSNREGETRMIASGSAARITALLARATLAARVQTAAVARDPARLARCREALEMLAVSQPATLRFAFFETGRRTALCGGIL